MGFIFFLGILYLHLATLTHALWPLPTDLQLGPSYVRLAPNFDIALAAGLDAGAPGDLKAALARTKHRIANDRHARLVEGRGQTDVALLVDAPTVSFLVLSLTAGDKPTQSIFVESVKPLPERREKYSLSLPSDGTPATIQADSTLGLLRGLTTFEQLWYWSGGITYSYEAPVIIRDDCPLYPYRGFHLDTARNFFPVKDILRTLDAMNMVKMNMLQWHIVDSQSFPLDVAGYPELSERGAYDAQSRYLAEDVQEVVRYAGERGIDVLVEIDTPGHTTSIASSHPEHVACANAEPWYNYAAEPPAGQLRISSPGTRKFTAALLKSIAATLPSSMFGTGGDEINMRCYLDDEQTRNELREAGLPVSDIGVNAILDEFIKETHGALRDLKKTPVVWEEVALRHGLKNLSNDTIVTIWTDSDRAADAVNEGFRIVHAPSNYFYLASLFARCTAHTTPYTIGNQDCGGGNWLGDWPGGKSWCDPFKTWQKAMSFDPMELIKPSQAHLILGGEAVAMTVCASVFSRQGQQLLWTEQASPENLDSIVWPRAAASAEVFWTGPLRGSNRSYSEALPRLHDLRYRMVQRGINAIALPPHWCALRPAKCDSPPWTKTLSTFQTISAKVRRKAWKMAVKHSRKVVTILGRIPEL